MSLISIYFVRRNFLSSYDRLHLNAFVVFCGGIFFVVRSMDVGSCAAVTFFLGLARVLIIALVSVLFFIRVITKSKGDIGTMAARTVLLLGAVPPTIAFSILVCVLFSRQDILRRLLAYSYFGSSDCFLLFM